MVFCYTIDMEILPGDEKYLITDPKAGIMYKVDTHGVPDEAGNRYNIVDELDTGYMVYISPKTMQGEVGDCSQPLSLYFVRNQFVINHEQKD